MTFLWKRLQNAPFQANRIDQRDPATERGPGCPTGDDNKIIKQPRCEEIATAVAVGISVLLLLYFFLHRPVYSCWFLPGRDCYDKVVLNTDTHTHTHTPVAVEEEGRTTKIPTSGFAEVGDESAVDNHDGS